MQKEAILIEVSEAENESRLDKFITNHLKNFSRTEIQRIIINGGVLVNKSYVNQSSHKVKFGEKYKIFYDNKTLKPINLVPLNAPLDVIYEDEYLAVINKQAGIPTHPGVGNEQNSLVNILCYKFDKLSDYAGPEKRGIVHRLDKNTSGLIIVAKDNNTHELLFEMIQKKTIIKKYKALVWGLPKVINGTIENYLTKNPLNFKKIIVTNDQEKGRKAITHYKVNKVFLHGVFSLVECTLETGRTHQIRVHMSNMGHTIVGDPEYGTNKKRKIFKGLDQKIKDELKILNRQLLHSYYLNFEHPITKEILEFEIDLSNDFTKIINLLEK